MTEELEAVPTINTDILGNTDGVPIDINKFATMVNTWVDVRVDEKLSAQDEKVDEDLMTMKESIQEIIKNFNDGILKYLKSGLIVSINVGLIGFGWFLNSILG